MGRRPVGRKCLSKKDKKPRISKARVEASLCDLLARKPGPELKGGAPKFPHDLRVVRPPSGAPIILEVVDNAAKIINEDYAAGYLRKFVSYLPPKFGDYDVTYNECRAVVRSWIHQRADLQDLPKPVAFKSDPELCMTRLDFDPMLLGDDSLEKRAPVFAEMLSRMTNPEAFCMRIGSLYDADADRKQAVWLSGPADCGKSEFAWLIGVLSGSSYGILTNDDLAGPYWKAQIVGKRVGLVHEAAAKFIRSDAFKSITGDDEHAINQKHEKVIIAKLPVMMFFFSNNPPEIPHDEALMERIIDCRITPVPPGARRPKALVREELMAELPYIASYCHELYAPTAGGRIPASTDTLAETIGIFEGDYLDFIEHHFVKPDAVEGEDAPFVLRTRLRELVEEHFDKSTAHQFRIKRILQNRLLVAEKKKTFPTNSGTSTKQLYVLIGIRERTEKEKQFVGKEDKAKEKQNVVPFVRS